MRFDRPRTEPREDPSIQSHSRSPGLSCATSDLVYVSLPSQGCGQRTLGMEKVDKVTLCHTAVQRLYSSPRPLPALDLSLCSKLLCHLGLSFPDSEMVVAWEWGTYTVAEAPSPIQMWGLEGRTHRPAVIRVEEEGSGLEPAF